MKNLALLAAASLLLLVSAAAQAVIVFEGSGACLTAELEENGQITPVDCAGTRSRATIVLPDDYEFGVPHVYVGGDPTDPPFFGHFDAVLDFPPQEGALFRLEIDLDEEGIGSVLALFQPGNFLSDATGTWSTSWELLVGQRFYTASGIDWQRSLVTEPSSVALAALGVLLIALQSAITRRGQRAASLASSSRSINK